ncbi:vitamin K-dependent gamma-carboxylase-like isoform X2 [Physella acuta]|uniref:vitamin K-dependent gamma-carboxylase-like isoform X2 n=1 Tax=Physella acuta TaxID=109671 RepID=UPI0027DC87F8|nr:vitamin K-dependent gamma-carboxylase-like isoform X2 [Physella acuta]
MTGSMCRFVEVVLVHNYVKVHHILKKSSKMVCKNIKHVDEDSKKGKNNKTDNEVLKFLPKKSEDKWENLLGFQKESLSSWNDFVKLLCRPSDPACLGTIRFLFGFLMIIDTLQERGMSVVDKVWASKEICRFPLFSFIQPLPLEWMCVIYIIMLSGALGIMLGFFFRYSCAMYLISYWYIFFLDKTSWNNHSYLFGIMAFLFAVSDADRYWSVDGFLNPKIHNAHIPLWNYTLLRAQIFLVYFIAGLKKLDPDWVFGYSMDSLSKHWIFSPFTYLLSYSQIDMYVVHLGGLLIDLSIGFLLFFNKTRLSGLFIATSFHLMNANLFQIGMFPFAMLFTQFLFCSMDWPRKIFFYIPDMLKLLLPKDIEKKTSCHCIYNKEVLKSEDSMSTESVIFTEELPPVQPKLQHKLSSAFTLAFIFLQCFLPYSHGITKGYNNWTNGLYGYSWDMMIHSWSVQHIRITYYDKDTRDSGYLDPLVWTGGNRRWSYHADMIKQYAECISNNLQSYGINNVEIHFDIWLSLNSRFQQRMVNPHVDILTADWSPFQTPSWIMPLLADLSDWRVRLELIEKSLQKDNENAVDVVFVADFPDMYLENYVQQDFENTTLTVLDGNVLIEFPDLKKNITLKRDESLQIPPDTFHNVYTISGSASCYMYLFTNTTEAKVRKNFLQYQKDNENSSIEETSKKYKNDPYIQHYKALMAEVKTEKEKERKTFIENLKTILMHKYAMLKRGFRINLGAIYCLLTNDSFSMFLNTTYQQELEQAKS